MTRFMEIVQEYLDHQVKRPPGITEEELADLWEPHLEKFLDLIEAAVKAERQAEGDQ